MVSRAKGSTGTMALHCSQAKVWVKTHYERHEDGVVAKSTMYKHYEDFCREQGRSIMETSIFGRVVKGVFPDVTIRRLGGRDNLKYYYCGIKVKESSPHVNDNTTTTRPKRRVRNRRVVTERADVQRCLVWLHNNYVKSAEASVGKEEVYERYVDEVTHAGGEPLPHQSFSMVMSHAFPHLSRKKMGLGPNQHKFYFGLQEQGASRPLETMPPDLLNSVDHMFNNNGKLCYRDDHEQDDDDDYEDEYLCRSPVSDTSEGSLRDTATPLDQAAATTKWCTASCIKSEPSPDFGIQRLKLKDEPLVEDYPMVKEEPLDEPLDLHKYPSDEMETSYLTSSPERSPAPPATDSASPGSVRDRSRARIYKPRFHIISDYDDGSWTSEAGEVGYCNNQVSSPWESSLRAWLQSQLEKHPGVDVNRDQLYGHYVRQCEELGDTALPLTYFDETMLKVFSGVVTMIHPSEKTFYKGVRLQPHGSLFRLVEELVDGQLYCYSLDEDHPFPLHHHSMELSPSAAPRGSPLSEGEDEGRADDVYMERYREHSDEMHAMPEALRDGKYYLRMWLNNNFESMPDSCVLKAEAYRHYENYARSVNQTALEMNVFGKIVRQVFPKVTIRRLGGRSKPQYHYCGIAVKPCSPLFQYMSGKDPAQRSRKKEIATDNKSAELVIEWLRSQYQPGTDYVIMKSQVFTSYRDYCESVNENPVTINYFGKLVKHCFPNVEVRKFGGRSDPTWYYHGLVHREPQPEAGSCYQSDVPQEAASRPDEAHCHSSPIPIGRGTYGGGVPPTTTPMLHTVLMSQHQGHHSPLHQGHHSPLHQGHSPLLARRSPFPASPGDLYTHTPPPDLCGASPNTFARACPSPAGGEGAVLQQLRRYHPSSPYESGEVPGVTLLSRSPGDSAAQFCRSPRDVLDPEGAVIYPQGALTPGGGQVVPRGLAPRQLDLPNSHKRHKAHLPHGDHYDVMADMHLQ